MKPLSLSIVNNALSIGISSGLNLMIKGGVKLTTDWIIFEDGRYRVEEAILIAATNAAILMEKPYIEIFTGRTGKRWIKGGSLIQNYLMVELLDESDSLDIILDLNEEFKFILRQPEIQAGKVFAPDVKSSLKFMPSVPWEQLTIREFGKICSQLNLLDGSLK